MTIINSAPLAVPVKYVAAITGGGSGAISNILRRGGASSWFVEGLVPYSKESLVKFLGVEPEKFASEETANQMAVKSYLRAVELGVNPREAGGLGATAVLGKPSGEREGRAHFAHVSVQLHNRLTTYKYYLNDGKFEHRQEEEDFLSGKIEEILTSQTLPEYFYRSIHDYIGHTKLLLNTKRDYTLLNNDGVILKGYTLGTRKVVVYPGSFNPFHDGHAEVIKSVVNGYERIWLEISVLNVDKPAINLLSLDDRITSISRGLTKHGLHDKVAGIILTNTPKFTDKLWLLGPNVDFLVGSDTAKRMVDYKYGNPQDLIDTAEIYGTKFLVVRRPGHEFVVPRQFEGKGFTFTGGTGIDISSTQLRKEAV